MASLHGDSKNCIQSECNNLINGTTQLEKSFDDIIKGSDNDQRSSNATMVILLVNYSQHRLVFQSFLGLWYVLSLVGTICNGVNIFIFLKMGLEDSVTISFFVLSVSDISILLFALIHACSVVGALLDTDQGYWFYVKPVLITYFCAHFREMFSTSTTLITTYLAVQRCFCIAKPLHFKSMFTRSRSIWALGSSVIFSLFCFMPILGLHRTTRIRDPRFNKTQITISFAKGWDIAVKYNETVAGIFIPCFTQVIVVFCLFVMGRGLKQSATFRDRAAIKDKADAKNPESKRDLSSHDEKTSNKKNIILSKKDLSVLMQVLLICLIFVISNSPKIGIGITRLTLPGFDHIGKYQYLFRVLKTLRAPFELSNSAMNFFIYLKYNSKFRMIFNETFRFSKGEEKG